MCGIAGIIHRGKSSNVGQEMTSMLQARSNIVGRTAPDLLCMAQTTPGDYVMRFVLAEQEDMSKGHDMKKVVEERLELVEERLAEHGAR